MQIRLLNLLAACGLVGLLACCSACGGPAEVVPPTVPYVLDLPPGFPALEVPADNALSSERVALGRMLFYDPILSRDSSISCGSCHLQAAAFTDGTRISPGVEGRLGTRNTPTLVNLAYQPYFFAEGGSPTLELQSIGPIEAQHEMDLPIGEAVQRLQQSPRYANLAEQAYQRPMDVFVITRALAAFERTLISGHSPYDRFIRQHQTDALSAEAQRGMTLFFSEQSGCGSCHNGLHLTDYQFYNLGLSATDQADLGRYRLTLDSADIGAFKTPSLRNVALTAPYMHDGSLPTLRSVIEHFDQGGKGHRLQSPLVRPLHLTDQQKDDLLAFLQALTDARFLSDPAYAPLP